MDIHKPKPVHGWREFLAEIGVIVIGVLIALAAEQVVDTLRLEHQAAENEQAFRADLGEDVVNAAERLALRPCASERLAHLSAKLARGQAWAADPQPVASAYPDARLEIHETFHTPGRDWPRSSWETGIHSEAIHLLSEHRRSKYALIFEQVSEMVSAQAAQEAATAELVPLAYDLELTPELRAHFLAELGAIQNQEETIQVLAEQIIDDARVLGALPEAKRVADIVQWQRKFRGACVHDVTLPSPVAKDR